MVFHKVLAAFLALSSASPANLPVEDIVVDPSMNISNIHQIYCTKDDYVIAGTGFLIANNVLATANHVAENSHCVDYTAGVPLKTYKTDRRHDFALMTGDIKELGPYTRYSCLHPVPGQIYISYGWSSMDLPDFFKPILRNNTVHATKKFIVDSNAVPGFLNTQGMRIYSDAIVAGTSGGPVTDEFGTVYAVNNAGNDVQTILFDLADTGLCTKQWDS